MSDAQTTVIHSRFNRIVAVVAWIVCALVVGSLVVNGDASLVWVYAAAALIAFLAWAALWRPFIGISDGGVKLQNVSHSVVVPWEALIHIDTRYALTLHTPREKFSAWSAPAPGAMAGIRAGRRPANRETRAAEGHLRPGDMLGTESGDAATVIREQWRARIEAGTIAVGVADEAVVVRRWDVAVLAITLALVALTGWLLAVTA